MDPTKPTSTYIDIDMINQSNCSPEAKQFLKANNSGIKDFNHTMTCQINGLIWNSGVPKLLVKWGGAFETHEDPNIFLAICKELTEDFLNSLFEYLQTFALQRSALAT